MRRQRNLLGPQGMGGMVSLWGASSLIRSVQTGTINVSSPSVTATATVSSIVLENTIMFCWFTTQANTISDSRTSYVRGELTNTTTVTAYINANAGFTSVLKFLLMEFAPGVIKSIQRGTAAVPAASTSHNVTITTVDPLKCFASILGSTVDVNTLEAYEPNKCWLSSLVTSNTNIAIARNNAMTSAIFTSGYQLVEFF